MIALPKRTKKLTETDLVHACLAALNRLPRCQFWRNNTGMLRDANGRPVQFGLAVGSSDLIGCVAGRFVAIEVKMPGKEPRPSQEAWMHVVVMAGGHAAWVTSVDDACAFANRIREEVALDAIQR